MKRPTALFVASLLTLARGNYELQVRVYSYTNPGNRDWVGNNCNTNRSPCDVVFLFCLRSINTAETSNLCRFGSYNTEGSSISAESRAFTIGGTIANGVSNPLTFALSSSQWTGSFQLMVRLTDDDHPDSDDLIDRVAVNMVLGVSDSFTSRVRYNGIYNKASMEMSFRVMCQTNYYGSACNRLCVPRDDSQGHYTCDENGNIVCLSGYTDTSTSCISIVCAEGCDQGNCNAPGECNCFTGWSGVLCNQCVPSTNCVNGYCLTAGDCICNDGYSGALCQIDNDVCGHQQPCQNDGTCSNNGPDNYTCNCPPGITGADCEEDECNGNPCENGGTCMNTHGSFTCTCAVGWTGDTCDDNIDECNSTSPCQNGATCTDCVPLRASDANISNNTGGNCMDNIASYTCDCAPGFSGAECHINIDDCASSPCNASNSHECVDGINSYTCVCIPGYTGQNCDSEVDKCVTLDPCFNGATCQTLFNDFLCECPTGFTGVQCDININDCHPDLCLHGGTCMDEVNDFTCMCLPKYTGRQCENDSPTCDDKPCGKDEFCVPLVDGTFNCQPCVEGDFGCKSLNDGNSGSNGTNTDNTTRYSVIGGVGGVVLGFLLLLLILILICCCFKCCLCCSRTKEQQTGVTGQYQHKKTSIESGILQNPLYVSGSSFSANQPNAAVCSQTSDDIQYSQPYLWGNGGSLRVPMSFSTTPDPILSDNDPTAHKGNFDAGKDSTDNLQGCPLVQNPVYVMAKEVQEQHNVQLQPPNLPPPRMNAAGTLGVHTTKNMTPTMIPMPSSSSTNPSDGHYEQIPGAL